MTMTNRLLLAAGLLILDLAAFFIPLTALLMAYVIVFNPSWFRTFVKNLDGPS